MYICTFVQSFRFLKMGLYVWRRFQLFTLFQAGWICIWTALLKIIVISWLINIYEYSKKNQPHSYGSAHFATFKEIVASGLWDCYAEPAVYVGADQTTKSNKLHYLKDSSTTHVFAFAPSRSGKGVGLIIPTLLSYSSSVIISDFKLENWYLTSGFRRSMDHKVLKFDPTCLDGTGAKFNPL